jgi:hypothetical protein
MMSNQDIETFAREVLGCNCPDEVFQKIDCQDKISLEKDSPLSYHINIGNRLLIYVAPYPKPEILEETVLNLLTQGKQERDTLNFNRFRLVLVTDQSDTLDPLAQEILATSNPDDKLHLHVIDTGAFPGAC